jgi:hypothetical protein
MAQKPWIVPIPGTTKMDHLRENLDAVRVQLTPADLREIETAFSRIEIYGGRMSNLSTRVGAQALFGTNISHRQARAPRVLGGFSLLLGLLAVGSVCEARQDPPSGSPAVTAADASPASMRQEDSRVWMTVGERRFAITLTDDAAARAFAAQLPLTLDTSELSDSEKHADLPKPLPANASRPVSLFLSKRRGGATEAVGQHTGPS